MKCIEKNIAEQYFRYGVHDVPYWFNEYVLDRELKLVGTSMKGLNITINSGDCIVRNTNGKIRIFTMDQFTEMFDCFA